jgi:CHAT domain-containing protein
MRRSSPCWKEKKATKEAVLNSMEGADLAYFATHGIADDEKPMENSFLVLAGDDPFLTARNIMDLRNAGSFKQFPEMVILSACQTGLGKPMEAGVAGLARSFLLAGSNHVIMSLWNVDDEATAFLMNRFIYHLQEPGSFMPAEPLRQAMLDTRKEYPSPVQWASFSLFGIDY